MDTLGRLEDSPFGTAARRLTFGQRPTADEPGLLPTVPAAPEDDADNRRPTPSSPELADIRRDLDSVTAQMTNLTNLMQALYDQQQHQQQQPDRTNARQYDSPTARQHDSPTARQQQQQQQQEPDQTDQDDLQEQQQQQENEDRQYERAMATAAAATAAVGGEGGPQNGDSSEQGTIRCKLKCPISAMQIQQWHATHNPAQQCTNGDKRWTTNCTNHWDYIAKVRSPVTTAFLAGVSIPGSAAADAVEEFESETIPWLESDGTVPAQHLVAGLVMEGFKRASAAVSEDAKALVYCCVLRSKDLGGMLSEIELIGEYDMDSESELRAEELPGFKDFGGIK
jgi:hypothetical protein